MGKDQPPVRTITASELKEQWEALLDTVARGGSRIVVEAEGKPKVALISARHLQKLMNLEEE